MATNPRQLNDIKLLTVEYRNGFKTKNFRFNTPQNRDSIVTLIDTIKMYNSVFRVTGYTLAGTFI